MHTILKSPPKAVSIHQLGRVSLESKNDVGQLAGGKTSFLSFGPPPHGKPIQEEVLDSARLLDLMEKG